MFGFWNLNSNPITENWKRWSIWRKNMEFRSTKSMRKQKNSEMKKADNFLTLKSPNRTLINFFTYKWKKFRLFLFLSNGMVYGRQFGWRKNSHFIAVRKRTSDFYRKLWIHSDWWSSENSLYRFAHQAIRGLKAGLPVSRYRVELSWSCRRNVWIGCRPLPGVPIMAFFSLGISWQLLLDWCNTNAPGQTCLRFFPVRYWWSRTSERGSCFLRYLHSFQRHIFSLRNKGS